MINIKKTVLGHHLGQDVVCFTLTNQANISVSILNLGCIITQLNIPDNNGKCVDVVLGYDSWQDYLHNPCFFGGIVGRCANRLAPHVKIEGKEYSLPINEAVQGNHLHGGANGFIHHLWDAQVEDEAICFSRISGDGEEGYPGNLTVLHRIGLTNDNALIFEYEAHTDAATIVNLTNHSYINLAGHDKTVTAHHVQIKADFITPIEAKSLLPTGEIIRVAGTPFDVRSLKPIGNYPFDINYVLADSENKKEQLTLAAYMTDPQSTRSMKVYTDQKGMQFYTGCHIPNQGEKGKDGVTYYPYSAACFETQAFPNSVHFRHFTETVLLPHQTYSTKTVFQFGLCSLTENGTEV